MINQTSFLNGKLIGIGKIHVDGSIDYRRLEKPIRNRIVSGGLDNLLMFRGDNTLSTQDSIKYLWVDNGNNRYGAIEYSAFGSSREPTKFTDTQLGNKISSFTNTKKTGDGFCGSIYREFPRISHRISHIHAAVADAVTVGEIGWFGRWTINVNLYPMFSRVVLDEPYELEAGEQLITTYELDVTYGNGEAKHLSQFGSLLDIDGNPLQADYMTMMNKNYTPYISNSGTGEYNTSYNDGRTYTGRWWPVWCMGSNANFNQLAVAIVRGSTQIDFDKAFTENKSNWWLAINSSLYQPTVKDYEKGSFYRDVEYTLSPNWPSDDSYTKIQNICIMGVHYKFGYWNDGVWVPQFYPRYKNSTAKVRVRQQWSTVDTQ